MAALTGVSCSVDSLLNNTASFGGDTAGSRGDLNVLVINNTEARAVFTMGTYDDNDQNTLPDSRQFGADPDLGSLEAGDNSGIIDFTCARVLSIGGPDLLRFIQTNDPNFEGEIDPAAFVEGIFFSSSDPDSPNAALPTAGVAVDFNAFLGVDFPCGALIVLRLEVNDAGPEQFRVDLEVYPPE